jgi:hypothetical protein
MPRCCCGRNVRVWPTLRIQQCPLSLGLRQRPAACSRLRPLYRSDRPKAATGASGKPPEISAEPLPRRVAPPIRRPTQQPGTNNSKCARRSQIEEIAKTQEPAQRPSEQDTAPQEGLGAFPFECVRIESGSRQTQNPSVFASNGLQSIRCGHPLILRTAQSESGLDALTYRWVARNIACSLSNFLKSRQKLCTMAGELEAIIHRSL